MRRISLLAGGTVFLLVGCGIVGTYDYDDYKPKPEGSGGNGSVSSSGSGGNGGSGGSAGAGGNQVAPCLPGALDGGVPDGSSADGGPVTPVELCNNGFDDDCAGDGDCSVQSVSSAKFGDSLIQKVRSIHSNNKGDVAISGEYQGTLSFNSAILAQGTMAFQPYAARFNSNGDAIFVHDIARNGSAKAVVLRDDDLVMVGEYEKLVDATKKNIFIRRVDPNGKFVKPDGWHVEFGEDDANRGVDVATTIAANGPVFVAALIKGSVVPSKIVGCSTFTGSIGNSTDAVILALNSVSGSCNWWAQIVNANVTSIVANTSTVTIAGFYQGTINPAIWLDAQATSGPLAVGSFIAAYDAFTGVEKWHRTFITEGMDQRVSFTEATLDSLGNVAVTGTFAGTWNIDGHMYNSSENATSFDVIVASFDGATGNVRWADRFGGTGPQLANTIAELKGRILVGGKTTSAMAIQNDKDTGPLCVDSHCMFLLSLDEATGAPMWGRAFGGTEPFNGETRVKLATGMSNLWLASGWSTALDLGNGPLEPKTPGTDEDIFLAKFMSLP